MKINFNAMKGVAFVPQRKQHGSNSLIVYRRRMNLSQKQVAHLMGLDGSAMLSRYERGRSLPPLPMALRLGIVLRVPVEFLFGDYHDKLKTEIRAKEARFRSPVSKSPFFINNFRSP